MITKLPAGLKIEIDREADGRWIGEIPAIPVLAYGNTKQQAVANAEALALRVIADRIKHGEPPLAAIGSNTKKP